jgi:hypothetical protein
VVDVLAGKNLTIVNPQPDPIQTGQKIKSINTISTAAPVKK